MTKLSDTQSVILSAAAQRTDRFALPLPKSLKGGAAHKVVNANLYQLPEALALYARIASPVLSVTASDDSLTQWWKGRFTIEQYRERLRHVPQLTEAQISDAGHMLQHDQPEALARLIEDFLRD